MVKIC